MSRQVTNEIIDGICIVMFVLGTIGNILGVIVFSSRKFRRTSYGRLAMASLIINLLCVFRYSLLLHSKTRRWTTHAVGQTWFSCKLYRFSSCLRILSAFIIVAWTYERFSYVTRNYSFYRNHPLLRRYKFYLMALVSFVLVGMLTGPTVYFYDVKSIPLTFTTMRSPSLSNSSGHNEYASKNVDIRDAPSYRAVCGLKVPISIFWYHFLTDIHFGLNYTTLRSIFSEIIPSIFVILFNIGIIVHVIQSTSLISKSSISTNAPTSYGGSYQRKDGVHGLVVHNRPRTSWMNIVLILHSFLFCVSSLAATIVHWSTFDYILSHWTSVVILANCSLNFYVYCLGGKSFRSEIRQLFYRYLLIFWFERFLNLFRTKSQRDEAALAVRMRLVRHRNTLVPPPSGIQLQRMSTASGYN